MSYDKKNRNWISMENWTRDTRANLPPAQFFNCRFFTHFFPAFLFFLSLLHLTPPILPLRVRCCCCCCCCCCCPRPSIDDCHRSLRLSIVSAPIIHTLTPRLNEKGSWKWKKEIIKIKERRRNEILKKIINDRTKKRSKGRRKKRGDLNKYL